MSTSFPPGLEYRGRTLGAILSLSLVLTLLFLVFPAMDVNVGDDAGGYIDGEAYRGVVYPQFIDLFEGTGAPLLWTSVTQSLIFAVAAAYLAYRLAIATGQAWIGLVLVTLLVLNPMTYFFNRTIMTEGLYQSAFCIFLGALVGFCTRRSLGDFLVLGLATGAMIVIRPAGYAVIPVIAVAALAVFAMGAYRPWRGLVVVAVGIAAVLGAERVAYTNIHGPERESVLSNALYAKGGVIDAGESPYPADDPRTAVWNFLEHDEAGAARTALAEAPTVVIRYFMTHAYEADMFFTYKADELARLAEETGTSARTLMGEVGKDRISRDPAALVRLAALHYWGHFQPFYYGANQDEIDSYIAAHAPLPMGNASGRLMRDVFVPVAPRAIHAVMAAGWLVSLALIAAAVVAVFQEMRGRTLVLIAGLAALALHGQVMLASLFSIASVRYLAVTWPCVALAIATLIALVALQIGRSSPRSYSQPAGGLEDAH